MYVCRLTGEHSQAVSHSVRNADSSSQLAHVCQHARDYGNSHRLRGGVQVCLVKSAATSTCLACSAHAAFCLCWCRPLFLDYCGRAAVSTNISFARPGIERQDSVYSGLQVPFSAVLELLRLIIMPFQYGRVAPHFRTFMFVNRILNM